MRTKLLDPGYVGSLGGVGKPILAGVGGNVVFKLSGTPVTTAAIAPAPLGLVPKDVGVSGYILLPLILITQPPETFNTQEQSPTVGDPGLTDADLFDLVTIDQAVETFNTTEQAASGTDSVTTAIT